MKWYPRKRQPIADRIERFSMPEPNTGCHIWIGGHNGNGYPIIGIRNGLPKARTEYVHRVAYELVNGPIPDGLVVDHICNNPMCVNVAHLRAVTQRTNVLRSSSPSAIASRRTHCPKGHPYDARNTYTTPKGDRQCRICRSAHVKAHLLRKAA